MVGFALRIAAISFVGFFRFPYCPYFKPNKDLADSLTRRGSAIIKNHRTIFYAQECFGRSLYLLSSSTTSKGRAFRTRFWFRFPPPKAQTDASIPNANSV